jgi:hypothetical protein
LTDREIVFDRETYRLRLDTKGDSHVWLELATFSQPLVMMAGVDTLTDFDRDAHVSAPTVVEAAGATRISWRCKSALWDKTYHLDLFGRHLEFYADFAGVGRIDCVRYFETIPEDRYRPHFALTKHFNDKGHTAARTYAQTSPIGFRHVVCPEPNSHARQRFRPHEYAQVSVNADLDYCGGNFAANPGLFAFAVSANPDSEWLAMGLAAPPGEHRFSEFEYVGGDGFGLHINSWGAWRVNGEAQTPRLILVPGDSADDSLCGYVDRLLALGWVTRPRRDPAQWWSRPIVCGWGHQSYQGDLFRVRSPREREPDNAVYTLCTQLNYADIVRRVDETGVPWGTLVVDARWFLAGGLKDIDVGRWPDMRGFVEALHRRDKRVLLWWGPWDTTGLPDTECVRYDPTEQGHRANRPGRLSKFGSPTPGRRLSIDISLPEVRARIGRQLRMLLGSGPGNMNVDGLKIDHLAAAPGIYGLSFPAGSEGLFGVEAARLVQQVIYDAAKEVRPDALIIGQSPNPYFSEVQDMVRLGDIYSCDERSVADEMRFRARMARIADPTWLIDTDGWPMPSEPALVEYARVQPELGVPSLYYASHLDTTGGPISRQTFDEIRMAWTAEGER